jgi:hypothetical protein
MPGYALAELAKEVDQKRLKLTPRERARLIEVGAQLEKAARDNQAIAQRVISDVTIADVDENQRKDNLREKSTAISGQNGARTKSGANGPWFP